MHPTNFGVPALRDPAPTPHPTHPLAPDTPATPPQCRNTDAAAAPNPTPRRDPSDDRPAEQSDHTTELASNPAWKMRRFSADDAINFSLPDLIRDGQVEAVAARLRGFPGLLNQPDPVSSQTPLCLAAGAGQTAMVELLLKEGAQIDTLSKNDRTALMMAVCAGHPDIVRLLCANGAQVNRATIRDNQTALHMAATQGNSEMVSLLLAAHAKPNLQDDSGATPLMAACEQGHTAAAQALIAAGVAVDVMTDSNAHHTALSLACLKGAVEIVRQLIARGAKTDFPGSGSMLVSAAKARHTAIVSILLDHGIAVDFADQSGEIALVEACESGVLDLVILLLKHGANIESVDSGGETPLIAACRNGHTAIATLLLATSTAINNADKYGRTALFNACESGVSELVTLLLKHGANMASVDRDGETPFMAACRRGHTAIATLLLEKGAPINGTDREDRTALIHACRSGALDLVTRLLERGANMDRADEWGRTPFMAACENGHTDIATLLLEKGATFDGADHAGQTALFYPCQSGALDLVTLLLKQGANLHAVNKHNETPFMVACTKGHTDIATLLLANGAAIEDIDEFGRTALVRACNSEAPDLVTLLLKYGANMASVDEDGETPLMAACRNGRTATAKILVDAGADVNATDEAGDTVLLSACTAEAPDLVALLLAKGAAGLNQPGAWDRTPLMEACIGGHTATANILIDAGADITATDEAGDTAFALACDNGNTELIAFMLHNPRQRAAINQANYAGKTPLMRACEGGHSAAAQMLIASGASIHATDRDGNTLLGMACQVHCDLGRAEAHDLIDLLIAAGADLNEHGPDRQTILEYAIIARDISLVKKLVRAGAQLNARADTPRPTNALDVAVAYKNYRAVEYLLANEALPGFRFLIAPLPIVDLIAHQDFLTAPDTMPSHGLTNIQLIDDPAQFCMALITQISASTTEASNWQKWLSAQGMSELIIENMMHRLMHLPALSQAVAGPGKKPTGQQQAQLIAHLLSIRDATSDEEPFTGIGLSYDTQQSLNDMVQQQRALLVQAALAGAETLIESHAENLVDTALQHYSLSGNWNQDAFYKTLTKQGGLFTQTASRLGPLFLQAVNQAKLLTINTTLLGADMAQGQATLAAQFKTQVATHFKTLLEENAKNDKVPPGFNAGCDHVQRVTPSDFETAIGYFASAVFDQWSAILAAQGVTPPGSDAPQPLHQ